MKKITTPLLLIAACLFLSACISTEEFNEAQDLNRVNQELEQMLTIAINQDNREPKPQLALLGSYAFDKGNTLSSGHPRLAISYFRIAAIAFWRDDVAENNSQFFDVVNAGELLCAQLNEKAPDRDCLIGRFTPLLASVEDGLQKLTPPTPDAIKKFADEGAPGEVSPRNGALVNLINQTHKYEAFFARHPSMNTYFCTNIANAMYEYILPASAPSMDDITKQQPIIQGYKAQTGQDTKQGRVQAYLSGILPTCKTPLTDWNWPKQQ